jgi:hypothetical protein
LESGTSIFGSFSAIERNLKIISARSIHGGLHGAPPFEKKGDRIRLEISA